MNQRRHRRTPEPRKPAAVPAELHVDPRPVFRRIVLLHGAGNVTSGLSLVFGEPGLSGTFTLMSQAAPLAVWGAALITAGVLQLAGGGRIVWGHGIGAAVWLFTAGAAFVAVLIGISASGAGSLLLSGLLFTVAGLHLNGILFRRQEAIAARRGEQ